MVNNKKETLRSKTKGPSDTMKMYQHYFSDHADCGSIYIRGKLLGGMYRSGSDTIGVSLPAR